MSKFTICKIKLIILFSALFFTGQNFAAADEIPLYVTPVKKFTTANKYVSEGNKVEFRVVKDQDDIKVKAGDLIYGTITSYTPCEPGIKNAQVVFDNFDIERGKYVWGELYINGGDTGIQGKGAKSSEEASADASDLTKGRQVKIKPGNIFVFYVDSWPLYNLSYKFYNKDIFDNYILDITPVEKFTTASKNVKEGDVIKFKVVRNNSDFEVKTGDLIYGTILTYEPNDFDMKNAQVIFGDFRTIDNRLFEGKLNIGKKQRRPVYGPMSGPGIILLPFYIASFKFQKVIPGSEVTIKPEKDIFYIDTRISE